MPCNSLIEMFVQFWSIFSLCFDHCTLNKQFMWWLLLGREPMTFSFSGVASSLPYWNPRYAVGWRLHGISKPCSLAKIHNCTLGRCVNILRIWLISKQPLNFKQSYSSLDKGLFISYALYLVSRGEKWPSCFGFVFFLNVPPLSVKRAVELRQQWWNLQWEILRCGGV